ncbi:MAG: ABC transporter substrate-binding protein [Lachnospiraceae bacterium]
MKGKKVAAVMLAGLMAAGLLMGCGSSSSGNESSDASDETTQAQESSDGKQKIELWHYFNDASQGAIDRIVEEYNASQDTYEVVSTYIDREDMMNKYTLGAISGELPDIGMVDNPDMASYISLGVFQDITELAESWGELDQFYEAPLSTCYQDDKLYGLPNNTNSIVLYYNKDLLSAAGVEVPTTWDELKTAAQTLTADGTYGFAMSAQGSEEGTFSYIPWLYSAGGSTEDMSGEAAQKSMEFLKSMMDDGSMSQEVVNWTQSDVANAFIAGKAAMMQNGSWQISALADSGVNYGIALLPKDVENSSCIGGENFGICAGANTDGAWDFLKYFSSKDVSADFCEEAGKFPVRADAMDSKAIWSEDENYVTCAEALEVAVARGPEVQWPTISQSIYTALQSVLLGEDTVDSALGKAADTINEAVSE